MEPSTTHNQPRNYPPPLDTPHKGTPTPLRQSIEAHLTIVTAALAMARWLETATGWSSRRLITTARRYRTITITITCRTHPHSR